MDARLLSGVTVLATVVEKGQLHARRRTARALCVGGEPGYFTS
jgi:hypothetical protein